MSPPDTQSRRLNLSVLDALRGLAALYVMLSHVRSFLWIGQREYVSAEHGVGVILATSSASLTYAHHAVLLFFLISGFCIHYRQARLLTAPPEQRAFGNLLNVRSFAWRRFRRLYPVLLLALGVTAVLDYLGTQINPGFYLDRSWGPTPNFALPVVIGNLLLQGGLAVPVFGDNVPLWSLAWEFWFYALYPILLVLSSRLRAFGMVLVPATIAVLLLLIPVPVLPYWVTVVLTYWIVWAGGALIAEAYVGRVHLRGLRLLAPVAACGVLAVIALLAMRHVSAGQAGVAGFDDPVTDLLMSASLAVVLAYVLLELPAPVGRVVEGAARRLGPLGDISYSLYVVHFPLVLFIAAWWQARVGRLPYGMELAVPGALLAIGFGWCCWYFVERRCVSSTSAARRTSGAQPSRAAYAAMSARHASRAAAGSES